MRLLTASVCVASLVALSACGQDETKCKEGEKKNGNKCEAVAAADEQAAGGKEAKPGKDAKGGKGGAPTPEGEGSSEGEDEGGGEGGEESPVVAAHVGKIDTVVTLGDSISTAILADTTYGASLPASFLLNVLKAVPAGTNPAELLSGNVTVDPADVQKALALPELVAFAGGKPYSHAKKLAAYRKATVTPHNVAVIGAKAADLAGQVEAIKRKNLKGEVYATLMIGANDFVSGTTTANFSAAVKDALTDLLAAVPGKITVALIAIPSVPTVFEVAPAASTCAKVPQTPLSPAQDVKCEQIRKPFLGDVSSSEAAADAAARLKTMNDAIEKIAGETKRDGARIVFVGEVASKTFVTKEILAGDGFHPNAKGQEKLADVVWTKVFETKANAATLRAP